MSGIRWRSSSHVFASKTRFQIWGAGWRPAPPAVRLLDVEPQIAALAPRITGAVARRSSVSSTSPSPRRRVSAFAASRSCQPGNRGWSDRRARKHRLPAPLALHDPQSGRIALDGVDVRDADPAMSGAHRGGAAGDGSSERRLPRTSAMDGRMRAAPKSRRRRGPHVSTISSPVCRTVTTHRSASVV